MQNGSVRESAFFVKLAARLCCLLGACLVFSATAAYGQPGAAKQPTLREQVRAKGNVWFFYHGERLFSPITNLSTLVEHSDLVVKGRVVDEKTRLSDDEYYVLTDYTVEILEVYKDSGRIHPVDKRVIVTQAGGQLLVEGWPVRMDTPLPPIKWIQPHIFFVKRFNDSFGANYLTVSEAGSLPIKDSKIVCDTHPGRRGPATAEICGDTEENAVRKLREKLTKFILFPKERP